MSYTNKILVAFGFMALVTACGKSSDNNNNAAAQTCQAGYALTNTSGQNLCCPAGGTIGGGCVQPLINGVANNLTCPQSGYTQINSNGQNLCCPGGTLNSSCVAAVGVNGQAAVPYNGQYQQYPYGSQYQQYQQLPYSQYPYSQYQYQYQYQPQPNYYYGSGVGFSGSFWN